MLDLAEEIVRDEGAKALTIDALARAAGISKGGVQYAFASKEDLVRALVDRWTSKFDEVLNADDQAAPAELVRRYIRAMRASQEVPDAKMAGLMTSYLQDPGNLYGIREWYRAIFRRLETGTADGQAARVAFLAVEGLFLMRVVGIDKDGAWAAFLDDVEAVLARLVQDAAG
ncbi:TetR/AcrR family transcriptional regulator [Pleomorphomonas sp. JP5]|uniref:TetR/AcrR family transcriptional regulator n=1 Tax=Pleomorphomonas sp. JP5 TaxID=2942998 RepID=UPI002044C24F|nr:TetR/AcrR family transcriptional regulator [Pleomorphomonas sp. JP5]MCM5558407.1 TetR/AcrR family transcriptional regulator [Pleomorphomonas sp. JP5]